MNIEGNFTESCFLNVGCEVFLAQQCNFQNSETGGTCTTIDSINLSNVQSQFFTVNIPVGVWGSTLTANAYMHCSFEQISLAPTAPAVYFPGPISQFSFKTCYIQNSYGDGIWFRGNTLSGGVNPLQSADVEVDIHFEPVPLVSCVRFLTSAGPVSLANFTFAEYYMFATDSFFTTDGGTDYVEILNSSVSVNNSNTTAPIFNPVTGQMFFTGVVNIGGNEIGRAHV